MPSVIRFFLTLIILAGAVYGTMLALATFVEPTPREISETVPRSKLKVFRDE